MHGFPGQGNLKGERKRLLCEKDVCEKDVCMNGLLVWLIFLYVWFVWGSTLYGACWVGIRRGYLRGIVEGVEFSGDIF